jgi:uncharacterized protein (DUF433 family)
MDNASKLIAQIRAARKRRKEVLRRLQRGQTAAAIAADFGVSRQRIYALIKQAKKEAEARR